MYSLVYHSDERVAFDRSSLAELGEWCSARNYETAVTGYLNWQGGRFFQFLEGHERTVRDLMDAIRADGRHAVGRELELAAWSERRFADWDMCFLDPPEPAQARIQRVVGNAVRVMEAPAVLEAQVRASIVDKIERIAALVRENDRAGGTS